VLAIWRRREDHDGKLNNVDFARLGRYDYNSYYALYGYYTE